MRVKNPRAVCELGKGLINAVQIAYFCAQKFAALIGYLKRNTWVIPVCCALLMVPALFVNLAYLPIEIITDEPRRALVAMEMIYSGNWITPTLNGEYYYNKPPFYNWIIATSFLAFGEFSEFALRFPVVVSLMLYVGSVYYFNRKYFGWEQSFVTAFVFLTCGRIFFYDSFLGLISIFYAWVTYLTFMLIYHFYKQERLYTLFIVSYVLTAMGYLMKGLPSLVYQSFTLLALFIYKKRFKVLLSPPHFVGIAVFFALVGGYYWAYFSVNEGSVETVFTTILDESTKRTAQQFGWEATVLHLFTFPFEMMWHFAPWPIMMVLLLRKQNLAGIWEHPFAKYNAYVFLANILVYWVSVEVFPRYLHPHAPLIFTVLVFTYYQSPDSFWGKKMVKLFLHLLIGLISFGMVLFLVVVLWQPQADFLEKLYDLLYRVPHLQWASIGTALGVWLSAWLYLKLPKQRLAAFILFMLVLRIGFNLLILPPRTDKRDGYVNPAIQIGRFTKGSPLYVWKDSPVQDGTTFYIARERGEILRRNDEVEAGAYYLSNAENLEGMDYQKILNFKIYYYHHPMYLVKFAP